MIRNPQNGSYSSMICNSHLGAKTCISYPNSHNKFELPSLIYILLLLDGRLGCIDDLGYYSQLHNLKCLECLLTYDGAIPFIRHFATTHYLLLLTTMK